MLEKIKQAILERRINRALEKILAPTPEQNPVNNFYQKMVDTLIQTFGADALDKEKGLVKTDGHGNLSEETISYCNGLFCNNAFNLLFESPSIINPFKSFAYIDDVVSGGKNGIIDKESKTVSEKNIADISERYEALPVLPIVRAIGVISVKLNSVSENIGAAAPVNINESLSTVKETIDTMLDIMPRESIDNACLAINTMIKNAISASDDKEGTYKLQEEFLNKLIGNKKNPKLQSKAYLEMALMHKSQITKAIGFAGEEVTHDQNCKIAATECCKKAWQVLPAKEKELKAKAYAAYAKTARGAGIEEKDILPEFSPKPKREKSR